jgi:hypothetical protein
MLGGTGISPTPTASANWKSPLENEHHRLIHCDLITLGAGLGTSASSEAR